MDSHIFIIILVAAFCHAGWNSIIKAGPDKFSTMLLFSYIQGIIAAICLIFFVPLPAFSSLGWVLSGAFLHTGYKIFLMKAYQHADLSQVYPLARGTAPLLVFLFSVLFLHISFTPTEIIAILAISGGILVMALKSSERKSNKTGLGLSLIAACFTASYTLTDGIGARLSGNASGFILTLLLIDTVNLWLYARTQSDVALFPSSLKMWQSGCFAGAMSLGAYWITVWAFTQAPIALVASLREISILFAAIIAALVLKEPISRWRWISVSCIAFGAVLMRS